MAELLSTLAQATLSGGMIVRFEAIDPTTGANVTGVKVSNVAVLANLEAAGLSGQVPLDDAIPQWVPVPLDDQT